MLSLLIFAQTSRGEHEVPDPSAGIPIIAIVLIAIVIAAILLWAILVRTARKSKGGVQPPAEDTGRTHPGSPPLESIEPRS
jgi:hypothetical protein